jgi:hypothetical protein
MKKLFLPVLILIIAASCSTIKVSSDYDKTAGFPAYKTYAFTQEALNIGLDDLNKGRLLKAIETELSLKGFTKSDAPQVLIDVKIKGEQKQTATASTSGGYGAGYGYRWGGGFSTTTINYDSYTEGTLFVDMIDAAKKQLVWQGRGVKTIEPDASADKREKNINYAVKQIFTKYPPVIK